jgi:hypothetical protein
MKVNKSNVCKSMLALTFALLTHAVIKARSQELGSRTALEADLSQVVALSSTAPIEHLRVLGVTLDEKWRGTDSKTHALLMRSLALRFRQYDLRVPTNFSVARPILNRAFESLDSLSPEVAAQTLLLLEGTLGTAWKGQEPQDWARWRSNYVAGWLRTEARSLEAMDPTFTGEEVVALNVQPPFESGASPGADPRSISDPVLRATYERDLEANRRFTERLNLQHALKRDLPHLTNSVERVLVSAYARPPYAGADGLSSPLEPDFSELTGLVEKFIPDPERRNRVYTKLENSLPINVAMSLRDQRQKRVAGPEASVSAGKPSNVRSRIIAQLRGTAGGAAEGVGSGSGAAGSPQTGAQTGVAVQPGITLLGWFLGVLGLGAIGFIVLRARSSRNP